MIIYSAVLIHYQRVSNGQTDKQTDTQTICIAPRRENLVKLSGKSEILNDGEILWGQMCGIIQEQQTPRRSRDNWRTLNIISNSIIEVTRTTYGPAYSPTLYVMTD